MLCVDEGGSHLVCDRGQGTCTVVEMQVCEQDMGNLFGIYARPAQPVLQARVCVHVEYLASASVKALSKSGVDEDAFVRRFHDEAVAGHGNPVTVVGWCHACPQGAWHDAIHGATVESETPRVDRCHAHATQIK